MSANPLLCPACGREEPCVNCGSMTAGQKEATVWLRRLRVSIAGYGNSIREDDLDQAKVIARYMDELIEKLQSFITHPAQEAQAEEKPSHWAAIDDDNNIEMSFAADDGNDGEAARQECNDWINEHGACLRLRPLYLHPQPSFSEKPSASETPSAEDADVPRITEDALIGHAILPVGTPFAFVVSMAQAACKHYRKTHDAAIAAQRKEGE